MSRAAFEATISSPPYERDVRRFPKDPERTSWPGSYRDINVDLAWCMWKEAVRQAREAALRRMNDLDKQIGEEP